MYIINMKNWGFLNDDDNVALSKVAKSYSKKVKSAKTTETRKKYTAEFMKAYLKIGEDPTETVVRDNVWVFLIKTNKNKLTEAELDEIWIREVKNSERLGCVIS
jgi:ATP sulfurylase